MRYVLLKHKRDGDFHVDFLLDCGQERLLTWQITDHVFFDRLKFDGNFFNFAESPNRTNDIFYANCHRIFDHRREYLDISGDLGNLRGCVIRIEYGDWTLLEVCAKQLVIQTFGTNPANNFSMARLWRFEPQIEIALDLHGTSLDRLMQQLPPPGDENWVVSCTRVLGVY